MSLNKKVRKAIFPVAGLGTRFLPATKAMPKEMLPIIDKPLIQYAVEEALQAGIEEFIFVTGRGKSAIEDHFDSASELEAHLLAKGNQEACGALQQLSLKPGSVFYTRQAEPLGLGDAILCARSFINDEPFAVLLADDYIISPTPVLKQMMEHRDRLGGSMVAVQEIQDSSISNYGVIKPATGVPKIDSQNLSHGIYAVESVVEKPEINDAPSNLAVVGRYILTPEVFDYLARLQKSVNGEIQLTDSFNPLIQKQNFYALQFDGQRFDCGSRAGFVKATLATALERHDLSTEIHAFLNENTNLKVA